MNALKARAFHRTGCASLGSLGFRGFAPLFARNGYKWRHLVKTFRIKYPAERLQPQMSVTAYTGFVSVFAWSDWSGEVCPSRVTMVPVAVRRLKREICDSNFLR